MTTCARIIKSAEHASGVLKQAGCQAPLDVTQKKKNLSAIELSLRHTSFNALCGLCDPGDDKLWDLCSAGLLVVGEQAHLLATAPVAMKAYFGDQAHLLSTAPLALARYTQPITYVLAPASQS